MAGYTVSFANSNKLVVFKSLSIFDDPHPHPLPVVILKREVGGQEGGL